MKYKPGIGVDFVPRWCQLTAKAIRCYKNEMAFLSFPYKPLLVVPVYWIKDCVKIKNEFSTKT
jgi:hypothetical protein